jgi:nucleoside-diphosphate-sugar epimerase
VFGPGDRYGLKLFRLVQRGINVIPGPTIPQLSWIHVGDLVEAMVVAAERGQRLPPDSGTGLEEQGVYFVALDDRATMAEAANLAAEVQGLRIKRTFHVPRLLCRFVARFNDLRTWITGRPYWLTSDKLREVLAGPWICSAEKARRELDFVCRIDLAQGFRLTCQWYHEQGWLTRKDEGRRMKDESSQSF